MILDRRTARQFIKYVGVGILATALQYGLLVAAVEWLRMSAVLGSCIGFVISAAFNYWLNYHLTFRSRQSHIVAGSRFALVATTGLALNAALMTALVDGLKWPYLPSQVVTSFPVLMWNFLSNRGWSFASGPGKPREPAAGESK